MAKNKNTNHFNIIDWFKKIVKQQKKAVIYTFVGTVFTVIGTIIGYKVYINSLPSQISLLYSNHYMGRLKNVDNIEVFYSLLLPCVDGQVQLGTNDGGRSYGMPMMFNNTNKTITNLELKVWVHFPTLSVNKDDICSEYDILRFEPENSYMELKYKSNILRAWSAIPIPVRKMHQTEPKTDKPYVNRTLRMGYSMTYDGAEKPIYFSVLYDVNEKAMLSEEILNRFLDKVYNEVYEDENSICNSDQWLISVIQWYDYDVFDLPRYGNKNRYDRAKKKFIKKI